MKTGDEKRLNKRLLLGEQQPATKALMQELFDSLEVEGLVRKTGLYVDESGLSETEQPGGHVD